MCYKTTLAHHFRGRVWHQCTTSHLMYRSCLHLIRASLQAWHVWDILIKYKQERKQDKSHETLSVSSPLESKALENKNDHSLALYHDDLIRCSSEIESCLLATSYGWAMSFGSIADSHLVGL